MSVTRRKDAAASTTAPKNTIKTPIWALAIKWGALAAMLAIATAVIIRLAGQQSWIGIIIVSAMAMGGLIIYASHRAVPAKYLYPGLILLLALQVWPTVYTISIAFTNYGDGHIVSKQDSINQITSNSVVEVPGSPRYQLTVAVLNGQDPATGPINFLLVNPSDKSLSVGTSKGLKPLSSTGITFYPDGRIKSAPGYTALTPVQVNARSKELQAFAVPTPPDGGIKSVGITQAYKGKPTISYNAANDTLVDSTTGKVYHPVDARWVASDGTALPTGWKQYVGWANFKEVLTSQTLRDGFIGIFIWNVVFAFVSVASTFILGMLLALLFDSPRLRLKGLSRAVLIMPYAVPGFVTALTWYSMFNPQFGLINNLLHVHIDWYDSPNLMRSAILITNLWLGFPYMFIVCTGALQSIPTDVKEAARIDGASWRQTIQRVIMPLLTVAVGPLLVGSFAFNFNNFSLIWLFSQGGPFHADNTSIGYTDLLITYAYRLAFGGAGSNYGLASAISIFIFLIVASMSAVGFARSKAWEEVN
ncbi:MAG: ABC transporter permease subunit [Propionibacterium sp.]|nr:ABC transporter permease subunit [Propionibacterium sp.]